MALIVDKKPVGHVAVVFFSFTAGIALMTAGSIELLGLNWYGFSVTIVAMIILEVIIRRLICRIKFESGLEELAWCAFTGGIIGGYDYIMIGIMSLFPAQVPSYKLLIIGLVILGYHAYYLWRLVNLFQKEPGIHRKKLWVITRLHRADGQIKELVIQ